MHTRVVPSNSHDGSKALVLFFEAESVFCSFYPSKFKINVNEENPEDGKKVVEFNCTEQYFMYKKALLVGDQESANRILLATDPSEMKFIGRQLHMSKEQLNVWSRESRLVMYRACLEKFAQNDEMRLLLFRTHGMTLVEASPTDKIWGIGLVKTDKRAEQVETWQGTNWLGEALDGVREELWVRTEFKCDRNRVLAEPLAKRAQHLETH